jgi:hypothetical protein
MVCPLALLAVVAKSPRVSTVNCTAMRASSSTALENMTRAALLGKRGARRFRSTALRACGLPLAHVAAHVALGTRHAVVAHCASPWGARAASPTRLCARRPGVTGASAPASSGRRRRCAAQSRARKTASWASGGNGDRAQVAAALQGPRADGVKYRSLLRQVARLARQRAHGNSATRTRATPRSCPSATQSTCAAPSNQPWSSCTTGTTWRVRGNFPVCMTARSAPATVRATRHAACTSRLCSPTMRCLATDTTA